MANPTVDLGYILSTLQLLRRIPEFVTIVSEGTSELSRSLSGVIGRVTPLEGDDPALLALITGVVTYSLYRCPDREKEAASLFLLTLIDRLNNLEGPTCAEKVYALFRQELVQRLYCPKCEHASYCTGQPGCRDLMVVTPIPEGRLPNVKKMICDALRTTLARRCSVVISGPFIKNLLHNHSVNIK